MALTWGALAEEMGYLSCERAVGGVVQQAQGGPGYRAATISSGCLVFTLLLSSPDLRDSLARGVYCQQNTGTQNRGWWE